jgi:hypothetical protein
VHEAKRRFFLISQGQQSTMQDYLEQWMNHVDVIKMVGAHIAPNESIVADVAARNLSRRLIGLKRQNGIMQLLSCWEVTGIDMGN